MERRARTFTRILAGAAIAVSGCGGASNSTSSPPPPPVHNEWTWISGADVVDQAGVYGKQGTPSSSNSPGARAGASSWIDASGNFWLFGGYGAGAVLSPTVFEGDLNDLWKYSNGEWTWVSGSDQTEQPGNYGSTGVGAPGNVPGARWFATSWTDAAGNLWLFGGLGIDSTSTRGDLNDLWKFSNGEWTWMGGSKMAAQQGISGAWQGTGIYGTQGVPSPYNFPGAREWASGWTDTAGNLWLFGGEGTDSAGNLGYLNDLWKYSNGMWTWIAGSNLVDQLGVYGTLGNAAGGNTPGARVSSIAWTDKSGNLWLFGGEGDDATGKGIGCATSPYVCELNDVWKFDGTHWTWMGGSNVTDQPGIYGTQGIAASANIPGARTDAVGWLDAEGNLWLFGGLGNDSAGSYGELGDLWKFSGGQWIWVNGPNTVNQIGSYGTLGTAASTNEPVCRHWAVGWTDQSGNLWLFGGFNQWTPPFNGQFNDLWEYQP